MTDRPQLREGETLDEYIVRLDDLITVLDDEGPFDDWVWANLERAFAADLRTMQEHFLGDLSRFGAPRPPVGLHPGVPRVRYPIFELNPAVVTNALIAAGVVAPDTAGPCGVASVAQP